MLGGAVDQSQYQEWNVLVGYTPGRGYTVVVSGYYSHINLPNAANKQRGSENSKIPIPAHFVHAQTHAKNVSQFLLVGP